MPSLHLVYTDFQIRQLVRDVFELMGLDEQRQTELLKSLRAKSSLAVGPPTLHSLHVIVSRRASTDMD